MQIFKTVPKIGLFCVKKNPKWLELFLLTFLPQIDVGAPFPNFCYPIFFEFPATPIIIATKKFRVLYLLQQRKLLKNQEFFLKYNNWKSENVALSRFYT